MNKRNFLILFAVFFLQKITAQKVEDVKEINLETIEVISLSKIKSPQPKFRHTSYPKLIK